MVPLPAQSTRISKNPPTAVGWKWKLTSTVCSLCLLLLLHPAPQKPRRSFQRRPGTDAWSKTLGKWMGSGSVAPQEQSHNLIEVATVAPSKKPGGYFTAPAQPDPDDQFIIPPELEEEVKEIMKQHQQDQERATCGLLRHATLKESLHTVVIYSA